MQYQFQMTYTEEDYIAFHKFNGFESPWGKKNLRKFRIREVILMLLIALSYFYIAGRIQDICVYAYILVPAFILYATVSLILHKYLCLRRMIKRVRKQWKTKKAILITASTTEFHEDKLVDISATERLEQNYIAIEHICVWQNRYIYIYYSNGRVFLLPIPQIKAQCNFDEFMEFLTSKCNSKIAYYS